MQFLDVTEKPKFDRISGLDAVIAVDQKASVSGPGSTLGTFSGIYDLLRLLFARHHGVSRSVFSFNTELGDPNFTRIRLGIGRPQLPIPIADYVLMNFSQDQLTTLEEIRKGWHLIVSEIIKNGVEAAMNTFNCKNS